MLIDLQLFPCQEQQLLSSCSANDCNLDLGIPSCLQLLLGSHLRACVYEAGAKKNVQHGGLDKNSALLGQIIPRHISHLPHLPHLCPVSVPVGGYMGYIRKALEEGYSEYPRFAYCTDDMVRTSSVTVDGLGLFGLFWHGFT